MKPFFVFVAIIAMIVMLSAGPSKAQQSGTRQWTNAHGQVVTIPRPKNYAQCMNNGRNMGYGDAQNAAHCSKYFPRRN